EQLSRRLNPGASAQDRLSGSHPAQHLLECVEGMPRDHGILMLDGPEQTREQGVPARACAESGRPANVRDEHGRGEWKNINRPVPRPLVAGGMSNCQRKEAGDLVLGLIELLQKMLLDSLPF